MPSGATELAASPPAGAERPCAPCLAEGLELIGEFKGSGFKEPPLLARRADGQVVQLTRLLYLVAEACDGRRDAEAVAAAVTERFGRRVSADNIDFLVEGKLRPLGVLAGADGSTPQLEKRTPLLALRHRRPVLSERAVDRAARSLMWLHRPLAQVPLLVAIAAFDVWLFALHGLAGGLRGALYSPGLLLCVALSVAVATAFHELGHASACRHGGARPGVMGAGVYLVWPAFYCDVTDAYRLDRAGRLRTDLGGVYFNAIFALLCGGVYLVTGEEAALLAAFVQHIVLLQQLVPMLRFDGYYVLSDLTGVPDILSRIRPIFRSLLRPREPDPRVSELRPWVRAVVTAYLVALVPALAFMVVTMVMGAPRMLATTYDALGLQLDRLRTVSGVDQMALGGFQVLALLMPVAATSVGLGRTARRAGGGLVGWAGGNRGRTAMAATGAVAAVAAATYVVWPNGDYQPIRPGERGTIAEAVDSLPAAVGGRPSFTPARAARFAPVPTVREEESPLAPARPGADRRPGRAVTPPQQRARARGGEPVGSVRPAPTPAGTARPESPGDRSAPADPAATRTPEATASPAPATASPPAAATPSASPTPEAQAGAAG